MVVAVGNKGRLLSPRAGAVMPAFPAVPPEPVAGPGVPVATWGGVRPTGPPADRRQPAVLAVPLAIVLPLIRAVMAETWVRGEMSAVMQEVVVRVLALLRVVEELVLVFSLPVVVGVAAMPAAAVAGRRVSTTALAAAVAAAAA